MKVQFKKTIEVDSKEIATWKYDGEYSFYDNDKTEAKQEYILNMHNEKDVYVIYDENNELIGHCSFDYDEEDKEFSLGVQMKPSFTGRGMGTEVVEKIISFGRETYGFNELVLLVAKFNKRAIKVYENLGFQWVEEFTWFVNNEEKEFFKMKKSWN